MVGVVDSVRWSISSKGLSSIGVYELVTRSIRLREPGPVLCAEGRLYGRSDVSSEGNSMLRRMRPTVRARSVGGGFPVHDCVDANRNLVDSHGTEALGQRLSTQVRQDLVMTRAKR